MFSLLCGNKSVQAVCDIRNLFRLEDKSGYKFGSPGIEKTVLCLVFWSLVYGHRFVIDFIPISDAISAFGETKKFK